MADNRTREQRSYNMSRIRSKNTKPEITVRKYLFKNGIRFRLHSKAIMGKPDIVIQKWKSVIFVHGCFWHGHKGCKNAKVPVSNSVFWRNKIDANQKRDKTNTLLLKKMGWKVYTVWECQLVKKKIDKTLSNLVQKLLVSKN